MSIDLTKHHVFLSLLPGTSATDYMARLVDAGNAGVSWYQNAPMLIAELQRVHAALNESLETLQAIEIAASMRFSPEDILDENSPIREGMRAILAKHNKA